MEGHVGAASKQVSTMPSEKQEAIGLGQLRSNACAYLERVGTGEAFDVIHRGRLVARVIRDGRPVARIMSVA